MTLLRPALLALEDGSVWQGIGFGAPVDAVGEIVFNTSMTGVQEILTDPSYHRQIVTMTVPHVGNTGVNPEDDESDRIWGAGLIVRDLSPTVSNWRATGTLADWLTEQGIAAITELETRALVRHIREKGAMRAAMSAVDPDPERLVTLARETADMSGLDLAAEVSCAAPYEWTESADWWRPSARELTIGVNEVKRQVGQHYHVVAYDFGIKRNILRLLASRGCRITVVPATTPAADVLDLNPDGVFLSNGPGDPAAVAYAVSNVKTLLGRVPLFGICLGHQILALALGAKTFKMKFGHRGGNQPVRRPDGGRVEISAHNHGFAVDRSSLPDKAQVLRTHLGDDCCEGLVVPDLRAFSVQYHPESSPGPHDSDHLFDRFINLMNSEVSAHAQA
jgi:carbamoyl-phosphate synthase small subunit